MITLAPGRGIGTVSGMDTLKLPETTVVRLDNGLEILVVPEHSSPVVSVQAWVRVGSGMAAVGPSKKVGYAAR